MRKGSRAKDRKSNRIFKRNLKSRFKKGKKGVYFIFSKEIKKQKSNTKKAKVIKKLKIK